MATLFLIAILLFIFFWGWVFLLGSRSQIKFSPLYVPKRAHAEKGAHLGVISPWLKLLGDGVVLQKEGLMQKTVAFRGPDKEGYSANDLDALGRAVNMVLMRKGTGWAFHFEAQRFQVREYHSNEFPTKAHRIAEEERSTIFQREHTYFDSSYYLTVTYAPAKQTAQKLNSFFNEKVEASPLDKERSFFLTEFKNMIGELSRFVALVELTDSETLSYLHTAVSWNWFPLRVPEGRVYLDSILFDTDLKCYSDTLVMGDHLSKIVTLNGFPNSTTAGILDGLNRLGMEYRWTTRWIPYDTADARKYINDYEKKYHGERKSFKDSVSETGGSGMINQGAVALEGQASAAAAQLDLGLVAFGKMTTTVQVSQSVANGDIKSAASALAAKVAEVVQTINGAQFTAKVEGMNAMEAWKGMMPGNVYANIRRFMYSSTALTDILPVTAVWTGRGENRFTGLTGGVADPLLICGTDSTTPFYLNLDYQDVFHSMVIGPTGSGKTTLLASLALAFGKYRNPITSKWSRVFFFDVDRSVRQLAMATGATRYEPLVPGSITFQPLARLDDEADITWACDYIEQIVVLQGEVVRPRMRSAINTALKEMSHLERSDRTMTTFVQTVQYTDEEDQHTLKTVLQPYMLGGAYGELFDASLTELEDSFMTVFEMRKLLDKGARVTIPALTYLFREIERMLDGTMTLVILDEAWKYLETPTFAAEIVNWLNTGRKKKLGICLATQSLETVKKSTVSDALIVNCPTRFFLPHKDAREIAEVYQKFGLTDGEVATIATAIPKKDYLFKNAEGVRKFQLELGPKALRMISPMPNEVLDSLEGRAPEDVLDYLMSKVTK